MTTIKGCLQVSIPIVKAFFDAKFSVPSKIGEKIAFLGGNGVKIFGTPKRHILARNSVIWRIDRENRCRALGCRLREEPKKIAKSLDAHFRIFGVGVGVSISSWNFDSYGADKRELRSKTAVTFALCGGRHLWFDRKWVFKIHSLPNFNAVGWCAAELLINVKNLLFYNNV